MEDAMMEEYKMVIAVRMDLGMSKGKMMAQVAHAAVNCALASREKRPDTFRRWSLHGQTKIVVKVNDEKELFDLKMSADALDLINSVISDAGRTEIAPGSITCIGIGPDAEPKIDKVTGDLTMV